MPSILTLLLPAVLLQGRPGQATNTTSGPVELHLPRFLDETSPSSPLSPAAPRSLVTPLPGIATFQELIQDFGAIIKGNDWEGDGWGEEGDGWGEEALVGLEGSESRGAQMYRARPGDADDDYDSDNDYDSDYGVETYDGVAEARSSGYEAPQEYEPHDTYGAPHQEETYGSYGGHQDTGYKVIALNHLKHLNHINCPGSAKEAGTVWLREPKLQV
jgi:hypothetical protein